MPPSPLPSMTDPPTSVRVAVRIRPLLAVESSCSSCISPHPPSTLTIGPATFTFDRVFGALATQSDVYRDMIRPLTTGCLEGYNATVLAYGQTGSGKTHTVLGGEGTEERGIVPRALWEVFEVLEQRKRDLGAAFLSRDKRELVSSEKSNEKKEEMKGMEEEEDDDENNGSRPFSYSVCLQMVELYGEEIRDLTIPPSPSNPKLIIRENSSQGREPEVVGANLCRVRSAPEALLLLEKCMLRRVTGSTNMNRESSRSHAIMALHIFQKRRVPTGDNAGEYTSEVMRSKYHFVDLAGSERQKRSGASGHRLREGIDINRGLLVLGNVISALGDESRGPNSFVPYRDSKLTRLLQGGLGGNHRTVMIACASPAEKNFEESLCCLRYANRARNIKNHAVANVDEEGSAKAILELRSVVKTLAGELLRLRRGGEGMGQGEEIIKKTDFSTDELRKMAKTGRGLDKTPQLGTTMASSWSYMATSSSHPNLPVSPPPPPHYTYIAPLQVKEESDSSLHSLVIKAAKEIAQEKSFASQHHSKTYHVDNNECAHDTSYEPVNPNAIYAPDDEYYKDEACIGHAALFSEFSDSESDHDDHDQVVFNSPKRIPSKSESIIAADDADAVADSPHIVMMNARLTDLNHSIALKEKLLHQLIESQQKYERMRLFYVSKLQEMGVAVNEREAERDTLVFRLAELEHRATAGTMKKCIIPKMKAELNERTKALSALKKKYAGVAEFARASDRNVMHIKRLKEMITTMKRQKGDLQREIVAMRRAHSKELREAKKSLLVSGREVSKWKMTAAKKGSELENVLKISKARLEEIGRYRSRCSEIEKKKRRTAIKKQVMVNAGVDGVLVGENIKGKWRSVDMRKMREFLVKKVGEVRRREGVADRLAIEWEERIDIVDRLVELMERQEVNNDNTVAKGEDRDEVYALKMQLLYKEGMIRKLCERIGGRKGGGGEDGGGDVDCTHGALGNILEGKIELLDSPELKSICAGKDVCSGAILLVF
uniref:Kinesin motor domain-containing protein n=1 Tax=Corethron hystrix TaxID=216773 RepID=A0A7S1BE93_9STRA|mmetsp:Transcript_24332/g.55478  ORF Transcript_24332/g.55478 Transcript_24332/m.55478 type:complete len:1002 (+) Transcript_24332:43-3048(+)